MKIAYVGPFKFPSSAANSLRVWGVVQALQYLGHEVSVVGIGSETPERSLEMASDVDIFTAREYESGIFSRWPGVRGLFLGNATVEWLSRQLVRPDIVISYGPHAGYTIRLLRFCKSQNIPLILDLVEWYDPRHLPGGVLGPYAICNEFSMRILVRNATGLFVISRYLEKYYQGKGVPLLRLPPLFAVKANRETEYEADHSGLRRFCYSGSPGKKEDLYSLFGGLDLAWKEGFRFRFTFIGGGIDEILKDARLRRLSIFEYRDHMQFTGRVANNESRRVVANSDFQIVIRKVRRFSTAGFPSKVPESMSLGVPVVVNLFSDLDQHLKHGENAIIVDSPSIGAVRDGVVRAIKMSPTAVVEMKRRAQETASRSFDPQVQAARIEWFLSRFV